jgi:thiamine transporter
MLLSTFAEMSYYDKCGRILLYFTIALIAILTVIGLLTKKFNKEKLIDFSKYALGIIIGYSLCVCAVMLTLKFDDMVTNEEFIPILFYPILATVCVSVLLAIGGLIMSLLKPEKLKTYLFIAFGAFCIPVIVSIILISIYYSKEIATSSYYSDISNVGLIVGAIALVALIAFLGIAFDNKKEKSSTKSLVYAAISIALAFALSYIRLFRMPQGGSITLVSMLPIMLYSYMFGTKKGICAGMIFGLLQAIQDPWIIHPAQFLLDYPIAFSAVGLAGIIKEVKLFESKPVVSFILGGIIAGTIRYLCHVLSGIFAFSCYAFEGFGAVEWGFLYNTFTFVDLAIALVAGGFLFTSKSFSKYIKDISSSNTIEDIA